MIAIRMGGLMRCCIASLEDAPPHPAEGVSFRCKYCTDEYGMVFRDGAWEWAWPGVKS
jgi:hypothetical protein